MAAEVGLTGRDVAVQSTPTTTTPTAQIDPGFRAMLSYANGDPMSIAAQMISTGRTQDPRIWNEIQQTLGNAMALRIRDAITQNEHAREPVSGPEVPRSKDPEARDQLPVSQLPQDTQVRPVPAVTPAQDILPTQVEREVLGVHVTAPGGVRASALAEVLRVVQVEVGNNVYAQDHFRTSNVAIVIIPAHVSMTALPEFAHLKGQKTFDGRDWSTVRGSGGSPSPNGRFSIAVAEEGVRATDLKDTYPATYSVGMHELAHVLESKGMTREQRSRVKQLYDAHIKRDPRDANDTFTDKYGSENEQEYFAQSTNAFFDRNVMGTNHSGRPFLQQNDPEMYAFLVELYDTHRDKHGDAA